MIGELLQEPVYYGILERQYLLFLMFHRNNFIDPEFMTAARKFRFKEYFNDCYSDIRLKVSTWKRQDVRIVMFTAQPSTFYVQYRRCANTENLVSGDRHTNATAAYKNPAIKFTRGHAYCDALGEIRIVNSYFRVSAHILKIEVTFSEGKFDEPEIRPEFEPTTQTREVSDGIGSSTAQSAVVVARSDF